jgi:predicted DNA binding CopG/RHH family protein
MNEVQRFTREQLDRGRALSPLQILRFIEDFRALHLPRPKQKSRLISLKLSEPLLRAFKDKSQLSGVPYQTQIKALMRQWLGQA